MQYTNRVKPLKQDNKLKKTLYYSFFLILVNVKNYILILLKVKFNDE